MFEDCVDKVSRSPLSVDLGADFSPSQSPLERASLISNSQDIERVHTETAHTGQTETPNLEDDVDLHFVTFIEHDGFLVELDGSRNSPVNHGKIKEGLLEVSDFSEVSLFARELFVC